MKLFFSKGALKKKAGMAYEDVSLVVFNIRYLKVDTILYFDFVTVLLD